METFYNMKNILAVLTAIICLLTFNSFGQSKFQNDYFRDGMYHFDGLEKISEAELFTTFKSEFGLSNDYSLKRSNDVVEESGLFNSKYELYYKGIPVEGSMYNVRGEKGIVQSVNGFALQGLNINVTGLISEEDAINAAKDHIGANTYIWENDGMADKYPVPELIITKKRGEDYAHTVTNYALCYKIYRITHSIRF